MKYNFIKESKRHHYIPIFYLKKFLNDNNRFFIYDKKKDQMEKRSYSPKQKFFEWDRNTSMLLGKEIDLLETVYKEIDSKQSQLLNLLNASKPNEFIFSPMILRELKLFISFLYWRIPLTDEKIELLIKKSNLKEIGLKAVDNQTKKEIHQKERLKIFFLDETFQKLIRTHLPFLSIRSDYVIENNEDWNAIYSNKYRNMIGDNPIVYRNKLNGYGDICNELILPISSDKSIICSKHKMKRVSNYLPYVQDLVQIEQSLAFVACSDKNYLQETVGRYRVLSPQKKRNLKKTLFDLIDNN